MSGDGIGELLGEIVDAFSSMTSSTRKKKRTKEDFDRDFVDLRGGINQIDGSGSQSTAMLHNLKIWKPGDWEIYSENMFTEYFLLASDVDLNLMLDKLKKMVQLLPESEVNKYPNSDTTYSTDRRKKVLFTNVLLNLLSFVTLDYYQRGVYPHDNVNAGVLMAANNCQVPGRVGKLLNLCVDNDINLDCLFRSTRARYRDHCNVDDYAQLDMDSIGFTLDEKYMYDMSRQRMEALRDGQFGDYLLDAMIKTANNDLLSKAQEQVLDTVLIYSSDYKYVREELLLGLALKSEFSEAYHHLKEDHTGTKKGIWHVLTNRTIPKQRLAMTFAFHEATDKQSTIDALTNVIGLAKEAQCPGYKRLDPNYKKSTLSGLTDFFKSNHNDQTLLILLNNITARAVNCDFDKITNALAMLVVSVSREGFTPALSSQENAMVQGLKQIDQVAKKVESCSGMNKSNNAAAKIISQENLPNILEMLGDYSELVHGRRHAGEVLVKDMDWYLKSQLGFDKINAQDRELILNQARQVVHTASPAA